MIHDVDESLRNLLRREALGGSGAEVVFDAPTRDWAARRTGPVVDLFLYDIHEDLERRSMMTVQRRDDDGKVVTRARAPRMLRLSYLVSAWTQRSEDEHRMLSELLACLLRHETVPPDDLAGGLVNAPASVLLQVAQPAAGDRTTPDLWQALGGDLKPALDLVVIAPLTFPTSAPPPPVLEAPRLDVEQLA